MLVSMYVVGYVHMYFLTEEKAVAKEDDGEVERGRVGSSLHGSSFQCCQSRDCRVVCASSVS